MFSKPMPSRISALAAALLIAMGVVVPDATGQSSSEVIYTFTGEAVEGPDQLVSGYHTFTFHNDSDTAVEMQIVRLKGGATAEESLEASQKVDEAYATGGDAAAAFRRVNDLIDFWGGANVGAGERAAIGVPLEGGSYIIGAASAGEVEGDVHRVDAVKGLEVSTDGASSTPQVDVTVEMVDFAFIVPADLKAGEQIWEFVNRGEQAHHAVVQKVKVGKTVEDVMVFAETREGEDPTEEFTYIHILSPGSSNFVPLDLTPGTYIALCFLPDYAQGGDGAPHVAHGMMQVFTVASD